MLLALYPTSYFAPFNVKLIISSGWSGYYCIREALPLNDVNENAVANMNNVVDIVDARVCHEFVRNL